jgi:uncharacterized protein
MTARCPICRNPTDSENNSDFPFCSERCRLLDLGNWASEKHKISSPVFDESELEDEDRDSHQSRHEHHEHEDRENDRNAARGRHR